MKQNQKWTDYKICVCTHIDKNQESFRKLQRHSAAATRTAEPAPPPLSILLVWELPAPRHRAAASVTLTATLPALPAWHIPFRQKCSSRQCLHCSASITHPVPPKALHQASSFPSSALFPDMEISPGLDSRRASEPQASVTLLYSASNGIMKCDFR